MNAQELRRKAGELRDKVIAALRKAEGENRELTDDEKSVVGEWRAEAEKLIRRAEYIEGVEASLGGTQSAADAGANGQRSTLPLAAEDRSGRITPVPGGSEGDKRRSFADFLGCIDAFTARASSPRSRERAHESLANLYGSEYRELDTEERSRETRDLSITTGTAGAFLLPKDFRAQLMSIAGETSIVRSRAMVVPMSGFEIEWPMLDQTTAPTAGQTAFTGGVKGTWTGDAEAKPETEPKFRMGKMVAHELSGMTDVPRALLQKSAISVEALLYKLFGEAVAWYEDYAFLRGDGVGKPLGVLNAPALVSTAARGSATAITFANARLVWVKVPQSSRGRVVWLVSQAAEEKLLDMTGTANSVFVPSGIYIAGTGNAAAQPINYMLMGRPVIVSEKLPALNSAGDFGAYDFGQYMVGDPGQTEIAASEHYKFNTNQIVYRFIHRVGGMPWINNKITLADASTTVSPFVSLAVQ